MTITNIRSRQIVEIDDEELRSVIQAAMGAKLTDDTSKFEFVDDSEISTAAYIWNSCFSMRPFANTQSALAVMLDIIGEQLGVYNLLEAEARKLL